MAITLQSATRQRAAPCVHYVAVLIVDGTPENVAITSSELDAPVTTDDKQTYLRLWARYQRAKGKTLAQMVGAIVIGDIP